ncbi:hypothetical protein niasHT_003644 [Heterodera trifolii]|uniref:B30.2/SPRY domain-containing protein n=1 Tax=Heterodera trifolii TaxID=157864 RepID=A0ABD2MEU0_9BILA
MRDNQNVMAEKMSGIEEKLEKIENGIRENQNVMAEKMSGIVTNLEKFSLVSLLSSNILKQQIKNGIRENQNALAMILNKIENRMCDNQNGLATKLENGIRDNHKEASPMMNNSTLAVFYFPLPIFRWNASDCHPKIVINESTNAIQRIVTGTEKFYDSDDNIPFARSCRAEPIKMPSSAAGRIGIIYAEYRVLAISGNLFIGLSTKEMPLADECPGYYDISYGYVNYGSVRSKNANGNKVIISDNVPSFGTGDVIGCGLNWVTRQVFFTNNGQRMNITNLYVDEETADFYPTVSIVSHGDAVEANFGPNFQYELSNEF